MGIVFFCQSCGSRFEVDARFAGRVGHCKHCNQRVLIPKAEALASMANLPRLTPLEAAASAVAAPAVAARPGWIATAASNVSLAPLTVDRAPTLKKAVAKPGPLDGDSGPALYKVVESKHALAALGQPIPGSAFVKMFWRRELGGVQKILRWINDTAYLISIPFLLMILIGAAMKNRPLAILGAAVVVLLNIGRLVTGLANLVVIPFRDSLLKGIFFLIPPFTLIYLANHWKGLKKPVRRVAEPIITLVLVVLAFTFIPSLRRSDGDGGNLVDRVRTETKALEKELEGEVGKAKDLDVNQLGEKAKGALRDAEGKFRGDGQDSGPQAPPSSTPDNTPAGKAKGIEGGVRKYTDEILKQQP